MLDQPETQTNTQSTLLAELPLRLHHHAFAVKDQEVNRRFFEGALGLPLVATWCERIFSQDLGREHGLLPHFLRACRWQRLGVLPIRR